MSNKHGDSMSFPSPPTKLGRMNPKLFSVDNLPTSTDAGFPSINCHGNLKGGKKTSTSMWHLAPTTPQHGMSLERKERYWEGAPGLLYENGWNWCFSTSNGRDSKALETSPQLSHVLIDGLPQLCTSPRLKSQCQNMDLNHPKITWSSFWKNIQKYLQLHSLNGEAILYTAVGSSCSCRKKSLPFLRGTQLWQPQK